MPNERRSVNRRKFAYYMPVVDTKTQECIGYLADVSPKGFKLESQKPVPTNVEYTLRLDMTSAITNRPYITLQARSIWSQADTIFPNEFIHGFQILSISPEDEIIFQRIINNYGK